MAQFYEDFRGQTLGIVPAGFSAPWGALDLLTKASNPVAGSDVYLEVAPEAGLSDSSFTRAALEWGAGTTSGVTVVRARMLVAITGLDTIYNDYETKWLPGGLLSASGASTAARTGYAQWGSQDKVRIRKYEAGVGTTLVDTPTTDLGTGPKDLFFELTRNGGLLESRVWLATGTRPSAADASTTDASPLTVAGFLGLSLIVRDSNSPPIELYQIAAATDGDTVPTAPVVTVAAPSNAPVITSPSITTTDTTVSGDFTFDSGANTGDPVTGYEVRVDGGAWQSLGLPNPLEFTVSGLTPSTSYNTPGAELRATNDGGPGPVSGAVVFTTATAVATPINLSTTNLQATSARLNWERG